MKKSIVLQSIVLTMLLCPLCFAQTEEVLPDAPIRNPFVPQLPEKPEVIPTTNKPNANKQPTSTTNTRPANNQRPTQGNARGAQGNTQNPPEKPPVPQPNFRVSGIIWNSPRPQAIINGQVLDIGDEIDGYRIESINQTAIEVSIRGVTLTVEP